MVHIPGGHIFNTDNYGSYHEDTIPNLLVFRVRSLFISERHCVSWNTLIGYLNISV